MSAKQERISRFLSLILRHAPGKIGLALDRNGWADIAELLQKAGQHGTHITPEALREVVVTSDKRRFAFSDDGLRIRANQGHSLPTVDLALQPRTPPDVLYHGTASRFITSIRQSGLRPGARRHVHLKADTATAIDVGMRYGVPVVLTICAAQMHAQGHTFYCAENGVWLTDSVPLRFIDFPAPAR